MGGNEENRKAQGLWGQLVSRQVIKTLAIYVAVGWGFYEIASEYLEQFGFPAHTPRVLLMLLLLGFPAAIFLSWYFDLDRHGVHAEQRMGRKQWLVLLVSLALPVIGTVVAFPWINREVETNLAERDLTPVDQLQPNSIAVLPFENLSSDPDKVFLARGLAIEVWNRLVRVPVLNLAHKDRSFTADFSGLAMETVASVLNARFLLSGDLRLEGDKLRVTATLTDAASGEVVWTRPYERLLVDIFAVQDDVATAITDAVAGPETGEAFIKPGYRPSTNMQAYLDYLRFLAGSGALEQDIEELKRIVNQNSDFTEAYAYLAITCHFAAELGQEPPGGPNTECMWNAARRAVELNANLEPGFRTAHPHMALAAAHRMDWNWLDAQAQLDEAALLAPADQSLKFVQAFLWARLGLWDQAIPLLEQFQVQSGEDDMVFDLVWFHLDSGNPQLALELIEKSDHPMNMARGIALRLLGNLEQAEDFEARGLQETVGVPQDLTRALYAFWRGEKSAAEFTAVIDQAVERGRLPAALALNSFALAPIPDEFFARVPAFIDSRQLLIPFMWRMETRELREDSRFEEMVDQLGVVPYWRKYGWPQVCSPVAEGFECGP